MTTIDKVIKIAENEVGYLEKRTNSNLYDKNANAGSNNYTKYWADIKPDYQGQPWCACFVTWCFVKAFGQVMTKRLLKHYPYVYCPTMSGLFDLHANPQRGDIVIFKRNGTFTHTGIVTGVNGDYFTTIEGNTSGGSTIIANGGAVCKKGYSNSSLPGTKFCRPDYGLIKEGDELMSTEYEELKAKLTAVDNSLTNLYNIVIAAKSDIDALKHPMIYNYVDRNLPEWARPSIQKMMDRDLLKGDENGCLGLTDELLRVFVTNDRAGIYDRRWDGGQA